MVERAAPVPGATASPRIHRLAAPAAIAACVMVFYWVPMTSSSASIQGEAADAHYPMQKYLSDRLSPRRFPFWTPYGWRHAPIHPTGVSSECISRLYGRLSPDFGVPREPYGRDSGRVRLRAFRVFRGPRRAGGPVCGGGDVPMAAAGLPAGDRCFRPPLYGFGRPGGRGPDPGRVRTGRGV